MRSKWLKFIWAVFIPVLAQAQLSGTYTIDTNGTGANNYTSFTSAISALSTSGVSGAVTFNVKQGTYTEQVTIPAVTGASATNKITFQADPTNTSAATVTYSPTGTADNWTVRLNGCNDVTIKGLTITTGGTTYGRLVVHTGNVTNISFLDNTFNGVAGTSTSSNYAGIYYVTPTEAKGVWHVEGNTMNNISYGVYVYGSSYTTSMDSIFIENNVINTSYYGLYPRYAKYQKVHGNTVNALGTNAYNYLYYPSYGVDVQNNDMNCGTGYGFYIFTAPPSGGAISLIIENNDIEAGTYGIYASCSGSSSNTQFTSASIKKNNIRLTGTTNYGIYLNYANFPSTAPGIIENNMIASSGTGSIYGIYTYNCSNAVFQHNSINVNAGSLTSGRALYLNKSTSTTVFSASGNEFKNNIVVNTGGGYALEVASAATTGYATLDYNNYYASGSTPFGPGSTDLTAWQTASSQDANSVWGDPLFVSATDLHVQGSTPNNVGTALGVATDIDGDTRSATSPDMGADEYAPLTCFGVSGLGAANVSDVNLDATWSSNNSTTIGSQVRYRETGSTGAYTVLSGTGTSMTISGLMASTSYDFSVREICSVGDTCSWSPDATVTTAACALANQCQYTVYMTDAYGDGWNGNVISFSQRGMVSATVTLTGGTSAVDTIGLCSWDSVAVGVAALGSYTYEVGFTVVNAKGDTVLVRNNGPSSTASFNASATFGTFLPVCTACPPADMCAFTVNMSDSYGDGWNGNTVAFIQNGVTRIVGGTFASGSSAMETLLLCDSIPLTIQVGNLGSWTEEVGFTITNQSGVTVFSYSPGNSYNTSFVFGSFTPSCYVPACPTVEIVTDSLINGVHIPCTGGTTNISVVVTEAERPYDILWSTLDTTAFVNNISAGTYYVEIYDNAGCSVQDTVELTVGSNSTLAASIEIQTGSFNGYNIACAGNTSAALKAIINGGVGPYTYSWDNGATSQIETNFGAGSHSLIVTDGNGCTASANVSLTEPVALSASGSVTSNFAGYGVSCYGGTNATATAVTIGGVSPYYYAWDNTLFGQSVSGLSSGEHVLSVTDANGCQSFDTLFISAPSKILVSSFSVSQSNGYEVACNSSFGQAYATATGGSGVYTYSWSHGVLGDSTGLVPAGDYIVTATDANGCTAKDTVQMNQPNALQVGHNILSSQNGFGVSCYGDTDGEIAVSVSGGVSPYLYSWTNGGTNDTLSGLGAGVYALTVTDANGCSKSKTIQITQPTALVATTTVTSDFNGFGVSCFGLSNGVIAVNASGGVGTKTFSWNGGLLGTSSTVSNVVAGSYVVQVQDNNGCLAYDTAFVTQPSAQSISITVQNVSNGYGIACFNGTGSGIAVASGGAGINSLTWSHGIIGANSGNLSAGTYYATATDANGCTAVDTLTLTQPTPLTATSNIVSNYNGYSISCNGASDASIAAIAAGGVGNYTYSWNQGGTNDTLVGVPAGVYTVTVTDGNGCTKTATKTVVEPLALNAVASPYTNFNFYNVSCHGATDGKARVVATGGVGLKTYSWSTTPSQSSQIASNLEAGTYYVQVEDANGCTTSDTTTLIEPDPLAFSSSVEDANCYDESNGAISVSITGGISNTYLVNWGNGIYNPQIAGLHAGWHPFSVLDANGCGFTDSVFVGQPTPLEILIDTIPPTCMSSYDGEVYIMAQGGSPGYQYYLDGVQNNGHVTGLGTQGIYLKVMDSHGCDTTVYYEMPPLYEPCLFIPNVFTPNDNGENDTWKIRGFAWQTGFTLRVFNGQGAQVYYAESGTDVEWDGTVNGIPAPMGDYYYILESISSNETYYGTVTILR